MERVTRSIRWISILFFSFVTTCLYSQKIYPGSYGYGSDSRGAYALYERTKNTSDLPRILYVNTLDGANTSTGSNSGSFLWAIKQTYPRIIIFSVGGVIDLKNRWDEFTMVTLTSPYCTIYGQTAPFPGITITGATVNIRKNHDVLIQHIKFRPADDPSVHGTEISGVTGWGGNDHIVIDHCSFEWSIDQLFGINPGTDIALTNNLFAEPLHCNTHPTEGDECHGMFNTFMNSERISIIRNVYTNGHLRAPYLNSGMQDIYIANNIFHNIEYYAVYLTDARKTGVNTRMDVIGNYYLSGNNTMNNRDQLLYLKTIPNTARIYMHDNYHPKTSSQTELPMVRRESDANVNFASSSGVNRMSYSPISSSSTYESVLNGVGSFFWDRDEVDERVLNDLRNRRGSQLNYTSELSNTYLKRPGTSHTLNVPSNPHNDDNNNGFTNIEEWAAGTYMESLNGEVTVEGENIRINYDAPDKCKAVDMKLTTASSNTTLYSQNDISNGFTFKLHDVCANCGSGNYKITLTCHDETEELSFSISDNINITSYNPPETADIVNINYYSFSPSPTTVSVIGVDGVLLEYELPDTKVGSNAAQVDLSTLAPNDYTIRLSRGNTSDEIRVTRIDDGPGPVLEMETSVNNENITLTFTGPESCQTVNMELISSTNQSLYQLENMRNNHNFHIHDICPGCEAGYYEVILSCGDLEARSTFEVKDRIEVLSYTPEQTNDNVDINFYSINKGAVTVDIMLNGNVVDTYQQDNINPGSNEISIVLSNLQPDTYTIRLRRGQASDQFQVVKLEDSATTPIDINLDIEVLDVTVNYTAPANCNTVDMTLTRQGESTILHQAGGINSGYAFNLQEVCATCGAGDYDLTLTCGDVTSTNTFSIEDVLEITAHSPTDTYDLVNIRYYSMSAAPVTISISDLNGPVYEYIDNSTVMGPNVTAVDLSTFPATDYKIRLSRAEAADEVVVTRLADPVEGAFEAYATADDYNITISYTAPSDCQSVALSVLSPSSNNAIYEAADIQSGYSFLLNEVCPSCGPGTYEAVLVCGDRETKTTFTVEDNITITSYSPRQTYDNVNINYNSSNSAPLSVLIMQNGNEISSYEESNVLAGANSMTVDLQQMPAGDYIIRLQRNNVIAFCEVTKLNVSVAPELSGNVSINNEDITVNFDASDDCENVALKLYRSSAPNTLLHELSSVNDGLSFNLHDVCASCGADDYVILLSCGEVETPLSFTITDRLAILSHSPSETRTTVDINYFSVSQAATTLTVSNSNGIVEETEISNTRVGSNNTTVDLSGLAAGTYTVKLSRGAASDEVQVVRQADEVNEVTFTSSSTVDNTSVDIFYTAPSTCESISVLINSPSGTAVHEANNIESGYTFDLLEACPDCEPGTYTAVLYCGELESSTTFNITDQLEISSFSPQETFDEVNINFTSIMATPVSVSIAHNGNEVNSYQVSNIQPGSNSITVNLRPYDPDTYTITIQRNNASDMCQVVKKAVTAPEMSSSVKINNEDITVNFTAPADCNTIALTLVNENNPSSTLYETSGITDGFTFNLHDVCNTCGAGDYKVTLACGDIETSSSFTITDRINIISHSPTETQSIVTIKYFSTSPGSVRIMISGSGAVTEYQVDDTRIGENSVDVDMSSFAEGHYRIALLRESAFDYCEVLRLTDDATPGEPFKITQVKPKITTGDVSLTFTTPSAGAVNISVVNDLGLSVYNETYMAESGENKLVLRLKHLNNGNYTLLLTGAEGEDQETIKLQKTL